MISKLFSSHMEWEMKPRRGFKAINQVSMVSLLLPPWIEIFANFFPLSLWYKFLNPSQGLQKFDPFTISFWLSFQRLGFDSIRGILHWVLSSKQHGWIKKVQKGLKQVDIIRKTQIAGCMQTYVFCFCFCYLDCVQRWIENPTIYQKFKTMRIEP